MKASNKLGGRIPNRKRPSSAARIARASAGALEALENRVLMSSTVLGLWDFGSLSAAAANAANGPGTSGTTTAPGYSVTSPAETSPYTGGTAYTVGMANGSDTGYQYPAQGVSFSTDNTGYLIATGVADTGGNGGSEDGTAGYVWYIGGENKATGEWTDAAPIGTQGVQFNVPTTNPAGGLEPSNADVSVQFDMDVSSIKAEAQFMVEYTTDVNDPQPTWTDVTQNLTFGSGNVVDSNDLNGNYVTSGGNVTATIGTSSSNSIQLIQNNSTTNPSTYTDLVQAGSQYITNTVNGTAEGYTLVSQNGDYAQIHGPLVGGNNTAWLNDLTVALPANAINQPNFAFRVVNAGTGAGETSLSGTTGTTIFKNWRFNDIRFLATVPIPQKPVIEAQPVATSAEVGSNATFTASAQTFDTNTTVQWEVATPNGSGGYSAFTPYTSDSAPADSDSGITYNAANGYATDKLTVPVGSGQVKNGNLYEAIFTANTASTPNTTTTNTAQLTVTTKPAIVLNPQNVSVPVNSASVILDAYATGLPGLSVQWYVEAPGGTFQPITNNATYGGATTDVLTITSPTNTLSGNQYEAQFTDSDGTSTTTAATLSLSRSALVDWTFNSAITPLPSDQPYGSPQGFQPTIGSSSDSLTPLGMANDYNGSQSADYEDVISSTTTSANDPTYTEYTWRLRGLAGNGQFNNGWSNQAPEYTQGTEIDIPATGYDHFTLAFDWYCTSDGMRDLQVQYYDPTSGQWTNDGSPYIATSNDFYGVTTNDNSATGTGTPIPVFVNLSGISDLQNLSTLKVRLVSAYDPSLPQIDDANDQDVDSHGNELLTHGQYAQAQVDAANEQQELNFVIPYSGSYSNFTLDYNGQSTGPIGYSLGESASAIQTALDAIIPGGVTVTDNASSPADANSNQTDNYTVIFNDPNNTAELPITIDPASGNAAGGIGAAAGPGAVGLNIQASTNGVEQYNGATGNWRFDNIIVTGDTVAGAPTITAQPSPASFTIGGTPTSVSFSATGSSAASVQWWVSTPNANGEYAPFVPVTFTNSSVQTTSGTSTLTLTQPTLAQSGDVFEAVFTGSTGGTNTTSTAQLTVSPPTSFTPGDYVVLRTGDANYPDSPTSLDSSGNPNNVSSTVQVPMYLDEYTPSGTLVTSVPVPSTGPNALTLPSEQDPQHQGILNLSTNGDLLTFAGYQANEGSADANQPGSPDQPVIGVIGNSFSTLTTNTVVNSYTASGTPPSANPFIRGAYTNDGDEFWTFGKYANSGATTNGGLEYVAGTGPTATTTPVEGFADFRDIIAVNGQLYGGAGSSSVGTHGPYIVGNTVTNGTISTPLTEPKATLANSKSDNTLLGSYPGGQSASALAFVDDPSDPYTQNGVNVLYTIGDQGNPGIVKYYFNGTSWALTGPSSDFSTATDTASFNPTGLIAVSAPTQSDPNAVQLTISGGTGVYTYLDANGYSGAIPLDSFTPLISAPANQQFRGMALVPAPLPAWVSPVSHASWNQTQQTLTVTGTAQIVADPAASSAMPNITADGPSAKLSISTGGTTGTDFHIGGLTLINGANATVAKLGSSRTASNYNVLSVGAPTGTTAPTFNIGAGSTLDLADNDMIINDNAGDTTTFNNVQTDLSNASDSGKWDQPGLTSSVAATKPTAYGLGYETGAEYAAVNGGSTTFDGQKISSGSTIVKYTLLGDTTLTGNVGLGDLDDVLGNFNGGVDWAQGNFHYSGTTGLGDYSDVLANFNASAFSDLVSSNTATGGVATGNLTTGNLTTGNAATGNATAGNATGGNATGGKATTAAPPSNATASTSTNSTATPPKGSPTTSTPPKTPAKTPVVAGGSSKVVPVKSPAKPSSGKATSVTTSSSTAGKAKTTPVATKLPTLIKSTRKAALGADEIVW